MKHTRFLLVAALIGSVSVVGSGEVHADTSNIVGWGHDTMETATPPAGTDHVAISAGEDYGLALKTTGRSSAGATTTRAGDAAGRHRLRRDRRRRRSGLALKS